MSDTGSTEDHTESQIPESLGDLRESLEQLGLVTPIGGGLGGDATVRPEDCKKAPLKKLELERRAGGSNFEGRGFYLGPNKRGRTRTVLDKQGYGVLVHLTDEGLKRVTEAEIAAGEGKPGVLAQPDPDDCAAVEEKSAYKLVARYGGDYTERGLWLGDNPGWQVVTDDEGQQVLVFLAPDDDGARLESAASGGALRRV